MRLLGTLALTVAVSALSTVSSAEASPPVAPPTCHDARATIVGTAGDDRLEGTGGVDVIVGLAGDDRLVGMGGNDVLCGGPGADVLQAGPGDDRLFGGADRWNKSRNKLYGDRLEGGEGDDLLDAGFDTEHPGAKTGKRDVLDWLDSGSGVSVDVASGTASGQGNDDFVFHRRLRYFLTSHDDTFRGTDRTDKVWGAGGSNDIETGAGNDAVDLQGPESRPEDSSVVRTGIGDDSVKAGLGSYDVDLGSGDDYYHAYESGRTTLDAGTGADVVWQGLRCFTGEWSTCTAGSPADVAANVVSGGRAEDDGVDTLTLDLRTVGADPTEASWDLASGDLRLGGLLVATTPGFDRLGGQIGTGAVHLTVTGTPGDDDFTAVNTTTFHAGAGGDRYRGGGMVDHFDGGPGTDTYVSDAGGTGTNTCTDVEADPRGSCS